MSQVLDKRTADNRLFDIDCSKLLQAGETITSITSVLADQGGLVFTSPTVNSVPITYPDGRVVPIGQVCQVLISGGAIPSTTYHLNCTIRALFVTSINLALEATVVLRLINTP